MGPPPCSECQHQAKLGAPSSGRQPCGPLSVRSAYYCFPTKLRLRVGRFESNSQMFGHTQQCVLGIFGQPLQANKSMISESPVLNEGRRPRGGIAGRVQSTDRLAPYCRPTQFPQSRGNTLGCFGARGGPGVFGGSKLQPKLRGKFLPQPCPSGPMVGVVEQTSLGASGCV